MQTIYTAPLTGAERVKVLAEIADAQYLDDDDLIEVRDMVHAALGWG